VEGGGGTDNTLDFEGVVGSNQFDVVVFVVVVVVGGGVDFVSFGDFDGGSQEELQSLPSFVESDLKVGGRGGEVIEKWFRGGLRCMDFWRGRKKQGARNIVDGIVSGGC
jgi:hypothetical protein